MWIKLFQGFKISTISQNKTKKLYRLKVSLLSNRTELFALKKIVCDLIKNSEFDSLVYEQLLHLDARINLNITSCTPIISITICSCKSSKLESKLTKQKILKHQQIVDYYN